MIEEALIAFLQAQAGITQLVPAQEIRPHVIPEDSDLPCITVEMVDPGNITTMSGLNRTARSTFRIVAWSDRWSTSKAIAEQLDLALGSVRRATWGAHTGISVEPTTGDELVNMATGRCPVARDYVIWHRR